MNTITIKTLAEKLQVSVATVSKALKDSHEISIETKERVRKMAIALNYVPNLYASSLRKRKSNTIAVVLPEVADSYFSLAINGIESIAQKKGYHVLIYLTHENHQKQEAILNDFKSGRVDGVLMSTTAETTDYSHVRELQNSGIPVVFFDRVCEDIETAKITTNDFECGHLAGKHLVQQGCKKIAFLSISSSLSMSNKRAEGFHRALEDEHIKYKPTDIVNCKNDEQYNQALIKKLLLKKQRPDGIIASVEKLTTSVYLICKELGLAIPGDIKVVSFSNQVSAPILNPSLTTITQPAFDMGAIAATILFKALAKPGFNLKKESVVIPSQLVERDSTRVEGR
ncbi:MAG: LacI family DNA-binding transcriptional regulator [Chitinophagaceae bacterium]